MTKIRSLYRDTADRSLRQDVHRAPAGRCVPHDVVDFMAVPRLRDDPGEHDLLSVAGRPRLRFHGEALTVEMVKAVDIVCGSVATERLSQLVLLVRRQQGPRQPHRRAENSIQVEDVVEHRRQHIVAMPERGV
jgi:hypothetical protein